MTEAIINLDHRIEFQRDLIHVILRRRADDSHFTQYAYLDTDPTGEMPPTLTHWVTTTDSATPTNTTVPGIAFHRDDARKIAHAILDHLGEDPSRDAADLQRAVDDMANHLQDQRDTIYAREAELAEARATITGLERTLEAMDHVVAARMDNLNDLAQHRDDLREWTKPRILNLGTPQESADTDRAWATDACRAFLGGKCVTPGHDHDD